MKKIDSTVSQSPQATSATITSETAQPFESIIDPEQIYAPFTLTADLSHLTANQKAMIPLLIQASDIMDELFWRQSYGEKTDFLQSITEQQLKQYASINYGPWDRGHGIG